MLSALNGPAGRRGRRLLLAAAAVGTVGLTAIPAAGAAPGPALSIGMTHLNVYGAQCGTLAKAETEKCVDPFTGSPTTFAQESGQNYYTITVTNNTAEEKLAGTEVKVSDTLPKGMVYGNFFTAQFKSKTNWNCKLEPGVGGVNAGAITCSNITALAAGKAYPPIPLPILVKTDAVSSTNLASVSDGGGLPTETKPVEGETTVTPAVPFGVSKFTTTLYKAPEPFSETLTEPFSEAGGHPFAVTTEVVLNYTPSSEGELSSAHVVAAGGGAKEIQAEVPPGFVGNPENAPLCPIELLRGNACPENTAVGFAQVTVQPSIKNGKPVLFASPTEAKGGKASGLVFGLQPSPGHPAEFGFLVGEGVPFVLDAKLRSDGDYGVTVGDSAVGQKPVATKVTFCQSGAAGGKLGETAYHCKPPTPSRPYLTNLVACPSAPNWTLHTDPWYDPASYVSQTVAQNPGVTCGKSLPFNPALEFVPSAPSEGGTTQADKPNGITVNLNLPQSNDAGTNGTPELKNVKMTLPAGMTISPAAANGIEACTNAEFGLGTEFEAGGVKLPPGVAPTEPANPAHCPHASQVGTVEVFTPLLSGAPTIRGVAKKGEELNCSSGTWSNGAWNRSLEQREGGVEELENGNHERLKITYQWLRNGTGPVISSGSAYFPQAADEGKPLECQVTATNAGGSSVAASREVVIPLPSTLKEPAGIAPPVAPVSIAAPSGTASVGNTLTCAAGAWTGEPEPFAYQWLRNGATIAGANAASYALSGEDAGKVVQCQVKATNVGGSAIADSAAVVASPGATPAPPLPGAALQGQLFVGEPECNPCTEANHDAAEGRIFRLFLQVQDPTAGVVVKLYGKTKVNEETGRLETTFENQPQQPFELLTVKLKGGPGATLANPQTCGAATTTADLTPWSTPFTADAEPTSSFPVEGCATTTPFSPSFNAGTQGANATAAGTNPAEFSLTFSRQDGEQDLSGIAVHMPLGLVGKIAGVPLCGEAQANAGTCGPESQIGTATAYAGPGTEPFPTNGRVYLTGPYKGGPFGLSVVTPAVSGPHDEFNLGEVVVRSAIYIDPHTAAVSVVSDPLPQFRDGVQLRLKTVNVKINRSGFMYNPTSCAAQQVSATLTAAQGGSANVSSPFGLAGCTGLAFHPTFTAVTNGRTTKTEGASLDVKITYPPGAYANIGKSLTELPIALPSRLTTIQKACPDTTFEANPATCDEGSVIGHAIAYTPLLAKPLVGPAYLVSHGNRAFPDIVIVLQGEGITVDLDGLTDIKKGITKTTFESLPDSPISKFELSLPQGPHSALAGNVEVPLCEQPAVYLPTVLTGQNGAVLKQNTQITVTGCSPNVKITKAKLSGNGLLVTVATASGTGTVKISGRGLKTTTKNGLKPGTHQIQVPFNKVGKSMRSHHKKATIRISLTVGKQVAAKTTSARL